MSKDSCFSLRISACLSLKQKSWDWLLVMKKILLKNFTFPFACTAVFIAQSVLISDAYAATKTDYDGKWIAEINCARNAANDAE